MKQTARKQENRSSEAGRGGNKIEEEKREGNKMRGGNGTRRGR